MAEKSDGCCSCCFSRRLSSMKISPAPEDLKDMVEIRPNRKLRIRHINAKTREEAFKKEYKVFLDNIANTATTPRVVTVPRLNIRNGASFTSKGAPSGRTEQDTNTTQLPNSTFNGENSPRSNVKKAELTVSNVNANNSDLTPEGYPLNSKENTDLHSESRASVFSNGERSVMSSSNVFVALESRGKPSATHSIIAETDEGQSSRSAHSISIENGLPSSRLTPRKQSKLNIHNQIVSGPQISVSSPRKTQSNTRLTTSEIQTQSQPISDKDMAIFFIHGVGGSSNIWKAQLDYFEKLGCEIICMDLIGHGMSDAPDKKSAYTFNQILLDTTEIFDKFCNRKNIVIGHSYGCAFATVIARERRKWVSKLVLVSGGGPTPLAPQPGVFSLPLCVLACCRPCINSGFHRGAFHPSFKDTSKRQKAFDVPTYVLSYTMDGQYWPDGDDLYHSWISAPTLLVYGREDKLVHIDEEEDMLKTIYGSHLEVVENAGHMIMMEAPDKFNKLLYNFITGQPLSSASFDLDTHRTGADDQDYHVTHKSMNKSQVSLHSIRSCKSSKSMPHGLLSTSMK